MKTVRSPKIIITIFIGTLFFLGVVLFFIFGGIDFAKNYPKVLNYANSECRVDEISYKEYVCQTRYHTYNCYGPIWDVNYGPNGTRDAKVETEKRYRSSSEALNKAKEYKIDKSYSCWYDTRSPSKAQWDKPSVFIQTILLGCGGLSILLCILCFYITYRFVKQVKLHKEPDTLYPYAYTIF